MSEYIRAFLAFDLDKEEIINKIIQIQQLLAKTGIDAKFVDPENIHITIRFLGEIPVTMTPKIHEQMEKTQFKPFTIKISGLGVFPNINYPRIIWVGISQGADQLQHIFSQLEPNLQKLGFSPDKKGFSPHLTIARIRSAAGKQQLLSFLQKNIETDFGEINAISLRLKRSQLTPQGPIYSTLKEYRPQ
ncbi:MAG: RNA 2',3'-cyclic phosphodiesterase [Crenarchaeota archaeon]|nr:RNA 2',3'-cyclic phosphodiesterase [Thermoproteota archaeon]